VVGTAVCLAFVWAGQERRRHGLATLSTVVQVASLTAAGDSDGVPAAKEQLAQLTRQEWLTRAERELLVRADAHLSRLDHSPQQGAQAAATAVLLQASHAVSARLQEDCRPARLWTALGAALSLLVVCSLLLDLAWRRRDAPAALSPLLTTAVGSTDEGILITDTGESGGSPTIAFANQAFKLMAGVPGADLVGQPLSFLRSACLREKEFSLLEHSCSDSKSATMETVRWADGSKVHCEWHISPVREQPGGRVTHYISVLRDVTRLRVQEESLRQTNERLVEANRQLVENQRQLVHVEKMAFLGQMAAGVAHEINNPVAYITSNLETLTEDLEELLPEVADAGLSPRLRQFLGEAAEIFPGAIAGLDRVKDIVHGLKSFARPPDDAVQVADLNQELEGAIKIVWNELKDKCEVRRELGLIPPLRCRPGQLSQVFTNLIANAAQAISHRGVVVVSSELSGSEVVIRVSDDGEGIPSENLDRLFTPFFTTKPAGKGTGLGLSVSYGIVRNHGGVIEVESTVGRGSTFTVRLPLAGPGA
jgi:PAS domain S-box-containing protein